MTSKPYLTGHCSPVADEITATDLTVEGTLPLDLTGRLMRNSHNPKAGITPTRWFKGSGMVHDTVGACWPCRKRPCPSS